MFGSGITPLAVGRPRWVGSGHQIGRMEPAAIRGILAPALGPAQRAMPWPLRVSGSPTLCKNAVDTGNANASLAGNLLSRDACVRQRPLNPPTVGEATRNRTASIPARRNTSSDATMPIQNALVVMRWQPVRRGHP